MTTTNDQTGADACSVACTLPDEQQTARLGELMNGLLARRVSITELPDGYAITFTDGAATRTEIDAFIAFEQQCCSFMKYAVSGSEPVTLALTGPEGTKAFLEKWIHAGPLDSTPNATATATTLTRAGALGGAAAVAAAICCATPALAAIMGALGLASATGAVAGVIDTAVPVALLASVGLLVVGRRRRAAAATSDTSDCGC